MEKTGNYELLYIVHPDLESSIDKILDRVRSYITRRDGKITYEENWGKRKLAYQIAKNDVGIYILWYFSAPKESLVKIEKDLRLTEEVLRYMVLAQEPEEKKETKKKKTTEKVEKEVEKKETKKTEKKVDKRTEKERMDEIDEKLGKLLGEEENNKPKREAKK
ncbi:MAG: 30S ribosomal protein S6 [Patescibacteria group bacterium]|nr:30S ribosomal protein S6 [Patescibacteria group bacterium]